MSSGWPPEEDDRRRVPARRASAVGTAYGSRDAMSGYSGYAQYGPQDEDESGGPRHDYDGPNSYDGFNGTSYDGSSRYALPPAPRNGSGGYDVMGYSQPASGQPGAGAGSAGMGQGGYWDSGIGDGRPDDAGHYGANGTGSYVANGYAAPGYDQQRYDQPGYADLDTGPGYPDTNYGNNGYAGAGYAEPRYDDAGYQDRGYPGQGGGEQGYGYGQGYQESGYGQAGLTGQEAGYGAGEAGYGDPGNQHPAYGNQDYGDPGYGDPGYEDARYPGPAHDSLGYPDLSYQDAGYGAPAYADQGYSRHPDAGPAGTGRPGDAYGDGPAFGNGAAYGDEPAFPGAPAYGDAAPGSGAGYGEPAYDNGGYQADHGYPGAGIGMAGLQRAADDASGYVSPGFASGEFPAGTGLFSDTNTVSPDHAATGMLDSTGLLGGTGMLPAAGVPDGVTPNATTVLDNAAAGLFEAPGPADTSIDIPADRSGRGGAAAGLLEAPGPADTSIDIPADRSGRGNAAAGLLDAPGPADTSIDIIDIPGDRPGRSGKAGRGGRIRNPSPARTASRSGGRRRGRSGDRRLWIVLGGILALTAVAIVAILGTAFPSAPGGPAHSLVTPNRIGSFIRRPALEQQMNVGQLRKDVINMSSGQASHVVDGVYEAGTSTSGATPQIIMFIGGNLANASPADSVTSFTQRFKGAKITSAGSLGGEAACVNATASQPGSVAICAWFDNDSFGEVVSPTMNAATLAKTMRSIRPDVELIIKKKQ